MEALASELTASLAALGASLAEVAATLGDVNGALQGVLGSVDKIPVVGGLLGEAQAAACRSQLRRLAWRGACAPLLRDEGSPRPCP